MNVVCQVANGSHQVKGIVMQLSLKLTNLLQFVHVREAGVIQTVMSNQVLNKGVVEHAFVLHELSYSVGSCGILQYDARHTVACPLQ